MLLSLAAVALSFACSSRAPAGPSAQHVHAEVAAHTHEQRGVLESALTPPGQFTTLVERARALRQQPYAAPAEAPLPEALRAIDWYAYRTIRYRPERALWRDQPGRFEAQFFHLGFIYRTPVAMFVTQGDRTDPLPFSRDAFSYDGVPVPDAAFALGYSGLRLHTNLNSDRHRDEIIVFQGGTYFRSLGRGNALGLSARALAIDTGEPTPEEFPRFSELHLVKPGSDERSQWVLGLIEGRRVTGAAAFRITPGDDTSVDVALALFLREPVAVLGLAPFSSMYLYGESAPHRFDSLRPEVHDSDGLVYESNTGERVVRPLLNPARTRVSNYRLDSPRGFGLVQRDRDFASYQDLEERYQDRPSAWVQPIGDWGKGQLRLLEFATELESDDNIAMLWVPDQVPADGLSVRYRIHFGSAVEALGFGRANATRVRGQGQELAQFVIDFEVPRADQVPGTVELELSAPDTQVLSRALSRNPHVGGFRARFELKRSDATRLSELRAYLRAGNDVLTETWSYPWQPSQ
jgi:periplasmic glucans biosynthesis protein